VSLTYEEWRAAGCPSESLPEPERPKPTSGPTFNITAEIEAEADRLLAVPPSDLKKWAQRRALLHALILDKRVATESEVDDIRRAADGFRGVLAAVFDAKGK